MWTHKNTFAIGGLENVGFAQGQDHLMVLSSQGQGIFNCLTGEKVARLHNNDDWWDNFDETTHSIVGFDVLDSIVVPTCGLYGEDTLVKTTGDGWMLQISASEPDDKPFQQFPGAKNIFSVAR